MTLIAFYLPPAGKFSEGSIRYLIKSATLDGTTASGNPTTTWKLIWRLSSPLLIEEGHTAKVHFTCVELWGVSPNPALRKQPNRSPRSIRETRQSSKAPSRLQSQYFTSSTSSLIDNPRWIPIYSTTSVIIRSDEFGAYTVLPFDNGTLVLNMD